MIRTMEDLYKIIEVLLGNISEHCEGCVDEDCKGYVWLLPEEAKKLYEAGVPIAEINEEIYFIHSFPEQNGEIILDYEKPPCVLRETRKCSIYPSRPLVCRLYPLGLVTEQGSVWIAIHEDCAFSRNLGFNRKNFFQQVIDIFRQANTQLLSEILKTYKLVDNISMFPSGLNKYTKIMELKRR